MLFNKGESSDFVYFVISGRIITKFKVRVNGNEQYKSLVSVAGSYLGETDIIFKRQRP